MDNPVTPVPVWEKFVGNNVITHNYYLKLIHDKLYSPVYSTPYITIEDYIPVIDSIPRSASSPLCSARRENYHSDAKHPNCNPKSHFLFGPSCMNKICVSFSSIVDILNQTLNINHCVS